MDNRTTQASLKCVIASRAFAVEQNVHRWGTAEDCCVWNICPHWQGKSMKKNYFQTLNVSINRSIFPYNDIEWYLYVDFETKKRSFICGFSNDQEGVKAHTSVLDIWTMTESWEFFSL